MCKYKIQCRVKEKDAVGSYGAPISPDYDRISPAICTGGERIKLLLDESTKGFYNLLITTAFSRAFPDLWKGT